MRPGSPQKALFSPPPCSGPAALLGYFRLDKLLKQVSSSQLRKGSAYGRHTDRRRTYHDDGLRMLQLLVLLLSYAAANPWSTAPNRAEGSSNTDTSLSNGYGGCSFTHADTMFSCIIAVE